MIPQGPFSPFHQQRWIEIYNDGSATIPAFGLIQLSDSYRPDSASTQTPSGGRTVLKGSRPTSDSAANFAVNGPVPIEASKTGFGTMEFPCWVAYDTSSTPVFGEEWGCQQNSSLAKRGNTGFVILGDANNGLVRVGRPGTSTRPYASVKTGSAGTFSGSTTQDIVFAGTPDTQGGFTSALLGGGGVEFTWGGTQTEFVTLLTAQVWPQTTAPTSDTVLRIGLRGNTGSGYLSFLTAEWIDHTFFSGVAPPSRFTVCATLPITVATGTKYKMSAQRASGDTSFAITLFNCSMVMFKGY